MPAGGAYRPGDILTALQRQDDRGDQHRRRGPPRARRRALARARARARPTCVDLATLTGGDRDRARATSTRASSRTTTTGGSRSSPPATASGDHVWPLPLHRATGATSTRPFADMKNSSDLRQAAPVYAAELPRRSSPARARGRTSTSPGRPSSSAGGATTTLSVGRHRLRRPPARASSPQRLGGVNFDLSDEHELLREHRARVRDGARSRRSRRSSTASTASPTSSSPSSPSSG